MTGALGGPQGGRNGDRLMVRVRPGGPPGDLSGAVAGLHLTQPGSPVTATLAAPQLLALTPCRSTLLPRSHG